MKALRKYFLAGGLFVASFALLAFTTDLFEITKNLEIFNDLYKELNIYYVDDTDPAKLMNTGIDAMLKSLDPYTVYIPESRIEEVRFMTTGQYGGIGAMVRMIDDRVVITEPYDGFPAQKAGLRAGDIIVKVDGKELKEFDQEKITNTLQGPAGTKIKLTVERPGVDHPLEIDLTREDIKVPDVPFYTLFDNQTGYITLSSFTNTAHKEVLAAFQDLKKQGAEKMVLDLRGNGGGLLYQAINIVNMFVPKGKVIVETKGKNPKWDHTYESTKEPVDLEIPLIVLVDTSSASASEIVAGSLQDMDRAVIVGETTYGKGLVQETRKLTYNSMLKVTVAKYYIPSGRCIQKLDYSHRDEEGEIEQVPDSLLRHFTTENGRTVIDGRGIMPDVAVELPDLSKVAFELYRQNLIFDYATLYREKHDTIAPASQFKLSDKEYNDFIAWLKEKNFSYETETEIIYNKLIESTKEDKYYDEIKVDLEHLQELIEQSKASDFEKFREQIEDLLNNEIVSRYYYQRGRIENVLSSDPYLSKAMTIFESGEYQKILSGNTGK